MVVNGIDFPDEKIAAFCRRYGVSRLHLFGSILTDEFGPDSDVDVLVEFLPGQTPGMFVFGAMILELSELVGRRIDLRTPFDLSPHFRVHVLRTSRTLHAA